ncbi:MAG: hypothetical protein PHV59_06395, partial [Victivallales bacterium]|nr:hypothetical protein [Victivallales bacterium]
MPDNTGNTDSGKVPGMDNTQTRKTLKLKPISKDTPAKEGASGIVDPLTARNTDTGPLDVMDDTRTKKTVKLTPVQKGGTDELKPVVDP